MHTLASTNLNKGWFKPHLLILFLTHTPRRTCLVSLSWSYKVYTSLLKESRPLFFFRMKSGPPKLPLLGSDKAMVHGMEGKDHSTPKGSYTLHWFLHLDSLAITTLRKQSEEDNALPNMPIATVWHGLPHLPHNACFSVCFTSARGTVESCVMVMEYRCLPRRWNRVCFSVLSISLFLLKKSYPLKDYSLYIFLFNNFYISSSIYQIWRILL